MAGLWSDVRFGLRALAANPTFVVLAVLGLGIGIGASTMTFTVVNAALVRPLGSLDDERLVRIGEVRRSSGTQWADVSLPNFLDWQTALGERAQLAALRGASFAVGPRGADSRVDGAYATNDLFATLGVAPLLGRGLQPGDEAAGGVPVAVLSETYWRRELGADRSIVGQTLLIDGAPHLAVGVVPTLLDVGLPNIVRSARIWLPLPIGPSLPARDDRSLLVVGRLDVGESAQSLATRLSSVASALAVDYPENAGWGVGAMLLAETPRSGMRSALWVSFGAAVLVLLIACANLANLTLAHAMRRRHELGIRAAIGASPWRLARQLFCESVLVAACGAALGLFLARAGIDALVRFYETTTLAPAAIPIDAVSLLFTIAVAGLTTVLFGLVPALEAARGAARAHVAESGAGVTMTRSRGALRRGLIVAQVASSLVLLIGAVLLSRSFLNLLAVDGGVETERVTSIRIETQPNATDTAAVDVYVDRVLEALASVPGVESVAATTNLLPLRGGGMRSTVSLPGDTREARSGPVTAFTGVTPSFFATLGIPLLQGRGFAAGEQSGRVAVVSETLAKRLWRNDSALGRQLRLDADPERGAITVVGVARDIVTWDSSGDVPLPMVYLDIESFAARPIMFFVRSRGAEVPVSTAALVRATQSLDFSFWRILVTPMAQVARDPFWRYQTFSLWFTVFGVAAVVLALAGIYGLIASLVSQRWREVGIRMALGASRRGVLWLVLREGVVLVVAGTAIGLAMAYLLTRFMRSQLYGVEALDWPLFAVVAAGLAAVAMAASLAPAVRAARIDPTTLLRR